MYRPPCRIPRFPLHTPDDLNSRRLIINGYFDSEQQKTDIVKLNEWLLRDEYQSKVLHLRLFSCDHLL